MNGSRISGCSGVRYGEAVNVIPDAITNNAIIEIKDVKRVSLTKQIQGEYNAAVSSGKTFELHVREGTELSEPLRKMEKFKNFKIFLVNLREHENRQTYFC